MLETDVSAVNFDDKRMNIIKNWNQCIMHKK